MPWRSTGDGPIVEGCATPSQSGHFEDARMIGCLCGEVGANRRSFLGSARPPGRRLCGPKGMAVCVALARP